MFAITLAVALIGCAMAATPLVGTYGPEAALLLGILLAPVSAWAAARWARTHAPTSTKNKGSSSSGMPLRSILRGIGIRTLLWWGTPTLILGLNAVRVPLCDPLQGFFWMVLGPGISTLLNVTLGAALGLHLPRWGPWLAPLVPVISLATAGIEFWGTPGVFFMRHLLGIFPGPIYDRGIQIEPQYLTFRLVSLCAIPALAWLIRKNSKLPNNATQQPSKVSTTAVHIGFVICAALCTSLFLIATVFADRLNHRSTSGQLARVLKQSVQSERCTIVANPTTDADDLKRIASDCDFRVHQAEQRLGVQSPGNIRVYLFDSARQKGKWMGAGRTYVAKPWRNEIYIHGTHWPHPVLQHEIAHVVAAATATGPWRVPGPASGWIPNPSLIEGLAVALTWQTDDGWTPHQWARALLDLKRLPPLQQLSGLEFWKAQHHTAYMATGSFLRFVHDTYGPNALRTTYETNNLSQATGKPLPDLEQAWHAHLRTVPFPKQASAWAQDRFNQPGILQAKCPHHTAVIEAKMHRASTVDQNMTKALEYCGALLDLHRHNPRWRAEHLRLQARIGPWEFTKNHWDVEKQSLPWPQIRQLIQPLWNAAIENADWMFLNELQQIDRMGRIQTVAHMDQGTVTETSVAPLETTHLRTEQNNYISNHQQRAQAIRQWAWTTANDTGAVDPNLLQHTKVLLDATESAATRSVHAQWLTHNFPELGLGSYMLARIQMVENDLQSALGNVKASLSLGLMAPELTLEAQRMKAYLLAQSGQWRESLEAWRTIKNQHRGDPAWTAITTDWIERCQFWLAKKKAP